MAASWLSSRTQIGFELGPGLGVPGFDTCRGDAGVASPGGPENVWAFAASGAKAINAANRIVCRRIFEQALTKPLTR